MDPRRSLHRALVVGLLTVILVACGGDSAPRARGAAARRAAARTNADAGESATPPTPPIFDDAGRLLPSDEVVHGLPIPRGFELGETRPGHRVYVSNRVPVEALRGYLAAYAESARIDAMGTGFAMRNAHARDAAEDAPRFEARAMYVGPHRLRFDLVELAPPGVVPGASERERIDHAERMLDRALD